MFLRTNALLTSLRTPRPPKMVRRPGIEPGPPAWKAGILTTELTTLLLRIYFKMVTGVGFEPTPPKRLVPKTSALDHSATQPDL